MTFRSDRNDPEVAVTVMVDESIPIGEFAEITIGDRRGDGFLMDFQIF